MATFVVTVCLLYAFLILSSFIPNEAISNKMEKSALSYKKKEPFSFEGGEKLCKISDNYEDTILINISWNMGKGDLLAGALDTKYYGGALRGGFNKAQALCNLCGIYFVAFMRRCSQYTLKP